MQTVNDAETSPKHFRVFSFVEDIDTIVSLLVIIVTVS